ncbi:MAG TPA: UDP-N-acetylmuramate dehydrogenase [Candidatus Paceibacterota bacterium]|nr:UDP-N-acetylmuramate dehydrogenase [Candidatus Paceibacterota bacterium]
MKVRKNISLAPLSTFRIGGRADFFCLVKEPTDLFEAVEFARNKKIPYRILAGGSNIVFPDGRFKGLLIKISDGGIVKDKNRLIVGAGVALEEVIKKSISAGLKGLETLSGIPGTLGGAIVGNAGAYGHSISEVVERVKVWDPVGGQNLSKGAGSKGFFWISKKDCKFRYRESVFKHKPYIVVCAVLKFKNGNSKNLRKISRDIIKLRLKKYKPGLRCPGSFFKNVLVSEVSKKSLLKINKSKIIEGKIPAGYLLEEVGAKGMRVGGIEIANFHGNLLINRGGARAADVRKLAALLKKRVFEKFGIRLEEEIRYF